MYLTEHCTRWCCQPERYSRENLFFSSSNEQLLFYLHPYKNSRKMLLHFIQTSKEQFIYEQPIITYEHLRTRIYLWLPVLLGTKEATIWLLIFVTWRNPLLVLYSILQPGRSSIYFMTVRWLIACRGRYDLCELLMDLLALYPPHF